MAGIDKIYLNSLQQYKEFRNWCETHQFEDSFGNKFSLIDYLYIYKDEDIKEGDYFSVMNTPEYIDWILLNNCPLDFIQKRLHEMYRNPEKSLNGEFNNPRPLTFPKKVKFTEIEGIRGITKLARKEYYFLTDVRIPTDNYYSWGRFVEDSECNSVKLILPDRFYHGTELQSSGGKVKPKSKKAFIRWIMNQPFPVGSKIEYCILGRDRLGRYELSRGIITITK